MNFDDGRWGDWLVRTSAASDGRPDVMTYTDAGADKAVRVSGAPIADLFAKTTGTDGDFVVKVIDVFPRRTPPIRRWADISSRSASTSSAGVIARASANPSPIPANQVQEYKFRLPTVNHVFQPGHRIMIQVQSSLFPLYDRNPQKYVPNIFFAKKADYQKATVTIMRGGKTPSRCGCRSFRSRRRR